MSTLSDQYPSPLDEAKLRDALPAFHFYAKLASTPVDEQGNKKPVVYLYVSPKDLRRYANDKQYRVVLMRKMSDTSVANITFQFKELTRVSFNCTKYSVALGRSAPTTDLKELEMKINNTVEQGAEPPAAFRMNNILIDRVDELIAESNSVRLSLAQSLNQSPPPPIANVSREDRYTVGDQKPVDKQTLRFRVLPFEGASSNRSTETTPLNAIYHGAKTPGKRPVFSMSTGMGDSVATMMMTDTVGDNRPPMVNQYFTSGLTVGISHVWLSDVDPDKPGRPSASVLRLYPLHLILSKIQMPESTAGKNAGDDDVDQLAQLDALVAAMSKKLVTQ